MLQQRTKKTPAASADGSAQKVQLLSGWCPVMYLCRIDRAQIDFFSFRAFVVVSRKRMAKCSLADSLAMIPRPTDHPMPVRPSAFA